MYEQSGGISELSCQPFFPTARVRWSYDCFVLNITCCRSAKPLTIGTQSSTAQFKSQQAWPSHCGHRTTSLRHRREQHGLLALVSEDAQ
jgi:hypothetical protein